MYVYNFPAIAHPAETELQLDKIKDELLEFEHELTVDYEQPFDINSKHYKFDETNLKALIELLDVIHACETELHKFDKTLVDYAKTYVVEKNQKRGYYESDDEGDKE